MTPLQVLTIIRQYPIFNQLENDTIFLENLARCNNLPYCSTTTLYNLYNYSSLLTQADLIIEAVIIDDVVYIASILDLNEHTSVLCILDEAMKHNRPEIVKVVLSKQKQDKRTLKCLIRRATLNQYKEMVQVLNYYHHNVYDDNMDVCESNDIVRNHYH